jgi:hypothetical protein
MTREDFTVALEEQLRLLGVRCSRGDVQEFAESVWPLAEDDPDPVRWAERFVETGRGEGRA